MLIFLLFYFVFAIYYFNIHSLSILSLNTVLIWFFFLLFFKFKRPASKCLCSWEISVEENHLDYLRACLVLACFWTCWTQDLCPIRCLAWDWARPSSWYRDCSSLVLPSSGCCFEVDWACGPGRPSWSLGSERSGLEYLFLRFLPKCCCCWCFGPVRSNIQNRSGRCRCPSPRNQHLFGVPPSGCWSLVC